MPNVGVITLRSTHFYLIDCQGGKLMYDAGWVGQMPALLSRLRAYGVAPAEIKYVMFSHNHTDHADLVQEVKQACGARLIIHEVQVPHLASLEAFHARKGEPYVPIRVEKTDLVVSRREPAHPRSGRPGRLGRPHARPQPRPHRPGPRRRQGVHRRPAHARPRRARERDNRPASWRTLLALGARTFYPAHGEPFGAERVEL